jgi:hypothetical protein
MGQCAQCKILILQKIPQQSHSADSAGQRKVKHKLWQRGRMGNAAAGREPEIEYLYRTGLGLKMICDKLRLPRSATSLLRRHLIARKLFDPARRSPSWDGRMPAALIAHMKAKSAIADETRRIKEKASEKVASEKSRRVADRRARAAAAGVTEEAMRYRDNIDERRRRGAEIAKARYHRMKSVPWYKVKRAARNCVTRIVRKVGFRRCKQTRTREFLGCSYDEARAHIESQFQHGMTWENHGEWEIDHIRPLSSFDLTDAEQVKAAMHYSNLQPLWWRENMQKFDRWEGQQLLAV